mgnify:CR=1 FL=1
MRYCGNHDCRQARYFGEDEVYCSRCRQELTPCIQCLCLEEEFNPKNPTEVKACPSCGERLTDTYLGQCMAAQLKQMVGTIAEKASALD